MPWSGEFASAWAMWSRLREREGRGEATAVLVAETRAELKESWSEGDMNAWVVAREGVDDERGGTEERTDEWNNLSNDQGLLVIT